MIPAACSPTPSVVQDLFITETTRTLPLYLCPSLNNSALTNSPGPRYNSFICSAANFSAPSSPTPIQKGSAPPHSHSSCNFVITNLIGDKISNLGLSCATVCMELKFLLNET